MDGVSYRWQEITLAKKAFWGTSVVLMLSVAISMVVHGRTLSSAEAASVSRAREEAARERQAEVIRNREAEERRTKEAQIANEKRVFSDYAVGLVSIRGLTSAIQSRGYIKGKVVLIDVNDKAIDSINYDLSSDMIATTAAETGTVVWLDWGDQMIGTYTSGGGAYVYTCRLTVIDLSIPAKIAVRSFRGSDPPSYVTSRFYGQPHYGNKPTDKIVSYLESLPKR